MKRPPGFRAWRVPVGLLLVREESDGRWVILCGEPDVKMDNKHMDGRPHMHVGGWNSDDRRLLRRGLRAREAAAAVARQLSTKGYLDLERLEEELR